MKFICWLFRLFGFVPEKDLNVSTEECRSLRDSIHNLESDNRILTEKNEALRLQLTEAELLDKVKLDETNKLLAIKVDKANNDMKQAEEFYNTVQKELHAIYSKDENFNFAGALAIPGASKIKSFTYSDNGKDEAVVYGRTLLLDEVTAKINATPSITEKHSIAINAMLKLGLIDRIVKSLLECGAIQLTVAFNPDCTTSELYYQVKAAVNPDTFVVDFNRK